MTKPISISIPHKLTRQEARRRISEGFDRIGGQLAPKSGNALTTRWTGDRMDFQVQAMGQAVTGRVEVGDSAVAMEIALPAMLAAMAGMVKERVAREGQLMLTSDKA